MAQEVVIKAIVQHRYGSPDVLELKDVDKPVARANEVLVRVQAAAVNIADWHLLRGIPYAMRPVGLLKPRHEIPGRDLAGRVEAVGGAVEQFRPGDEVFGCATAPLPSTRVLRRTAFWRSRATSRSSKPRPLETRPSPPQCRS
jgi:NADPH:quinone reductase-like Zn-dependent oxidoreductase